MKDTLSIIVMVLCVLFFIAYIMTIAGCEEDGNEWTERVVEQSVERAYDIYHGY